MRREGGESIAASRFAVAVYIDGRWRGRPILRQAVMKMEASGLKIGPLPTENRRHPVFTHRGARSARCRSQHEVIFLVDAMKNLPHAQLVEARTMVMQTTFSCADPF